MKKLLCIGIAGIVVFSILTIPVYAAKGYEGFAIYRDGVLSSALFPSGFEWHAGLMYEPSVSYNLPIAHISNPAVF